MADDQSQTSTVSCTDLGCEIMNLCKAQISKDMVADPLMYISAHLDLKKKNQAHGVRLGFGFFSMFAFCLALFQVLSGLSLLSQEGGVVVKVDSPSEVAIEMSEVEHMEGTVEEAEEAGDEEQAPSDDEEVGMEDPQVKEEAEGDSEEFETAGQEEAPLQTTEEPIFEEPVTEEELGEPTDEPEELQEEILDEPETPEPEELQQDDLCDEGSSISSGEEAQAADQSSPQTSSSPIPDDILMVTASVVSPVLTCLLTFLGVLMFLQADDTKWVTGLPFMALKNSLLVVTCSAFAWCIFKGVESDQLDVYLVDIFVDWFWLQVVISVAYAWYEGHRQTEIRSKNRADERVQEEIDRIQNKLQDRIAKMMKRKAESLAEQTPLSSQTRSTEEFKLKPSRHERTPSFA